jgi:aerobic C4-dicarboxylate transport protein
MSRRRAWYSILYIQVLVAIVVGVFLGHFYPRIGIQVKPLGDAFVALIRMMIAPVIFCIVVQGIGSVSDMKKVGRVGIKTLVYFEVVSTFALIIGILVAITFRPGLGLNIDLATLDPKSVATFVGRAKDAGIVPFLLAIIPRTVVDAFSTGDVLQVLLISILTGFALSRLGEVGERATRAIGLVTKAIFGMIRIIVRLAPIGAFGAMAFTVASLGVASLSNLAKLIGAFYLTSLIFVILILGTVAHWAGFSIFRFIG